MSEETSSSTDTAALIASLSQLWKKYKVQDDELWRSFRETFKGHTEEDFKIPHHSHLQRLRTLPRKQEHCKIIMEYVAKGDTNNLNRGGDKQMPKLRVF